VLAPWHEGAEAGARVLVLNPGSAFGLGTHPTTRACLALTPPPPVGRPTAAALDVGTGTGILALWAAQLGDQPVDACDLDAEAARAAGENLRLNGREDRIALLAGGTAALRPGRRYALILANLLLGPLRELAEDLAGRLAPGGCVVAAGIRPEDACELAAAYEAHGLRVEAEQTLDEWAALRLRRGPLDP
jgi:ribosomal protein L11 methyltransferase